MAPPETPVALVEPASEARATVTGTRP